jgi:hypothetical protein
MGKKPKNKQIGKKKEKKNHTPEVNSVNKTWGTCSLLLFSLYF